MSSKVFECPSCKNPVIIVKQAGLEYDQNIIKCNGVYSDSRMAHTVEPCGLSMSSCGRIEGLIQTSEVLK